MRSAEPHLLSFREMLSCDIGPRVDAFSTCLKFSTVICDARLSLTLLMAKEEFLRACSRLGGSGTLIFFLRSFIFTGVGACSLDEFCPGYLACYYRDIRPPSSLSFTELKSSAIARDPALTLVFVPGLGTILDVLPFLESLLRLLIENFPLLCIGLLTPF